MKKAMTFSKVATALAATAFAGGVCAIDLPAPDADGKIVLSEVGGRYVANGNVTCAQVVFGANNISLDLSKDGGKTIAVPSTVTSDGFSFSGRFAAEVLGGVWDFGGNASMKVGSGDNHNVAIGFSGTKVRNVGEIQIGANRRNCTLSLKDAAELEAANLRIANGSTSDHCTFEISGGSKASFSGGLFIPEDGSTIGAGYNMLRIDGAGSSVSAPNANVTFGRGCPGDRMSISNKGAATFSSLAIGGNYSGAYAADTVLTVDDARLTTSEHFTIGNNARGSTGLVEKAELAIGTDAKIGVGANATGNLLSVSGSVVTVGGTLSVGNEGSAGNRAEFRDSAISVGSIVVGSDADSVGNTLVLAGAVTLSRTQAGADPFFFGEAGNNEIILTDGFLYEPAADSLMAASGNNAVRVRNGAKVTKDEGIWYFGTNASRCRDNTYFVEAGGTTVVYRVNLGGCRNKIVVSNGVFEVLRKDVSSENALIVGADSEDREANPTTGCELVLRGTRPQYVSKGETKVLGDGKGVLRFELPAAALETVPMSCGMITVQEGAAIRVACDDYLSWLGTDRADIVLARANRQTAPHLWVPQSVLDDANAGLPERCRLVVDGQILVLKIAGDKGTVISIR